LLSVHSEMLACGEEEHNGEGPEGPPLRSTGAGEVASGPAEGEFLGALDWIKAFMCGRIYGHL
jgi:hypothetical protein